MSKRPLHDFTIKLLSIAIIIQGAGFIYLGMSNATDASSEWQLIPFFGMAVISVAVLNLIANQRMCKDG